MGGRIGQREVATPGYPMGLRPPPTCPLLLQKVMSSPMAFRRREYPPSTGINTASGSRMIPLPPSSLFIPSSVFLPASVSPSCRGPFPRQTSHSIYILHPEGHRHCFLTSTGSSSQVIVGPKLPRCLFPPSLGLSQWPPSASSTSPRRHP